MVVGAYKFASSGEMIAVPSMRMSERGVSRPCSDRSGVERFGERKLTARTRPLVTLEVGAAVGVEAAVGGAAVDSADGLAKSASPSGDGMKRTVGEIPDAETSNGEISNGEVSDGEI